MTQEIFNEYKEYVIGKEFLYVSKYGGRTKGVVEDVSLLISSPFPLEGQTQYFRSEIRIISTKRNAYRLSEVYLKSEV